MMKMPLVANLPGTPGGLMDIERILSTTGTTMDNFD
jgi:hypothetical protein